MKQKLSLLLLLAFSLVAQAQQGCDSQKLSGYLRFLAKEHAVEATRGTQAEQKTVCTLMKLSGSESIQTVANRHGCQVLDSIGRIYFVQVPVCQLASMSIDNAVQRVEANEMPMPTMDGVPSRISADKIWEGFNIPQAYTGRGVIAGVADIGFDFSHPMFKDGEGNSRICQFVDMAQKDADGKYGVTYDAEALSEIDYSSRALVQTHGTHVASLMVGSAVQGGKASYSGIAPESDIVLSEVAANSKDTTDNTSGTSINILLGIKRMFDFAEKSGKPCVVNLSMGGWVSIMDAETLENQVISELTGPGHIFVSSAGNNGNYGASIIKTEGVKKVTARFLGDPGKDSGSSLSQAKSIQCILASSESQTIQFDFFGFGGSLSGGKIVQDSVLLNTDSLMSLNGDSCIFYVKNLHLANATIYAYKVPLPPFCAFDNCYQFNITLDFDGFLGSFSQWIRYHGVEVTIFSDSPCEMYTNPELTPFWRSPRSNIEENERYNCISYEHTICWPASSEDVIAVGAQNTRMAGYARDNMLANFSSQGPTWDNRIKPEVTAPGVGIRGAYNKFCNTFESDKNKFYDIIVENSGEEDYIIAYDGTSMSSPIVAGTIALWLQAKPDLTPSDIRDVIAHTCKQIDDDRVDGYPNNMYGYGEIDAYAGLLYILGISDNIKDIPKNQPSSIRVKLDGSIITLIDVSSGLPYMGEVVLTVYTVEGKTVALGHQNSLNLSSLPHGVYVIQVSATQQSATGSTLIRL